MSTVFILVLALIPTALMGQAKDASSVSIKDLRKAPTEVVLDGTSLSLSAYAWRDFTPGAWGAGGSPMMIVFKVTASDNKLVPSGVRIDRAWVLFGEQVWEIPDFRGRMKDPPHKEVPMKCPNAPVCEVPSRGGPQWGPGVYVDVVVRLADREGRYYLIQAPKQYVIATS